MCEFLTSDEWLENGVCQVFFLVYLLDHRCCMISSTDGHKLSLELGIGYSGKKKSIHEITLPDVSLTPVVYLSKLAVIQIILAPSSYPYPTLYVSRSWKCSAKFAGTERPWRNPNENRSFPILQLNRLPQLCMASTLGALKLQCTARDVLILVRKDDLP